MLVPGRGGSEREDAVQVFPAEVATGDGECCEKDLDTFVCLTY